MEYEAILIDASKCDKGPKEILDLIYRHVEYYSTQNLFVYLQKNLN